MRFYALTDGRCITLRRTGRSTSKMLVDAPTAAAVAAAVRDFDPALPLVVLAGPGGELMAEAARAAELRAVLEAFPDRGYLDDGRLAPRSKPGAVIHDPLEVAARALHDGP